MSGKKIETILSISMFVFSQSCGSCGNQQSTSSIGLFGEDVVDLSVSSVPHDRSAENFPEDVQLISNLGIGN